MSCRWNHIRVHRRYHGQAGAGAYPGGGAGDKRDGLLPDAAQPPARLAHPGDRAGGDGLHHPQPGHRAVHRRPPGLLRLLLHDPGQLNLTTTHWHPVIHPLLTLKLYAILAGSFGENSPAAFGIFKFYQSLASTLSWLYSGYLELPWQLLIVTIFDVIGTFACIKLEMDFKR